MPLIQTLPQGKLDIIGDVHGQYEALQNLLHYLGYAPDGKHPQGRKLVFVGDLVDRGPDAPAVLQWYQQAHQQGHAYMVLGNHEMNLLTNEPKDGSGWFFNSRAEKDAQNYAPWNRLPEHQKPALIQFLKTQPLVLHRADLRIVHAAWLPEIVAQLQERNHEDILAVHQEWEEQLCCCLKHAPWFDDYLEEQRLYAHDLENINHQPNMLSATALHDVYKSKAHPIRALTCGIETVAPTPFFASGRWRFSVRHPWWDDYQDCIPVIIGHYWRQWQPVRKPPKHRENTFTVPAHHWHGARKNVFCCDFSVGARWRDRKRDIAPSQSEHRLAALRFPEKTLVFDNGETIATVYGI